MYTIYYELPFNIAFRAQWSIDGFDEKPLCALLEKSLKSQSLETCSILTDLPQT
jgi:hypothetical protein